MYDELWKTGDTTDTQSVALQSQLFHVKLVWS